jgi:carboxyl-terminal processing protease
VPRANLRQLRNVTVSLGLAWIVLALPALAAESSRFDDLRRNALACERRGEWLEACRCYDEILHQDRGNAEVRKAYQRCLRRYQIVRRHRDNTYRQVVTRLTPAQALDVYEQVLAIVAAAYVDRGKAQLPAMFQQGLQELRFALEETVFVQEHFAGATPEAVAAFRDRLEAWGERKLANGREARDQVLAVARAGLQVGLPARPGLVTIIALEFACGACNALDEYTLFLTPGSFSDAQAGLRGRAVGVGIDLALVDQHLEIARVYPRGPAREAGLLRHDRLLRINGAEVGDLPPDAAAERLRGEAGTAVRLEILTPGQEEPRVVELVRRAVNVPSVEYEVQTVMTDTGEMVPIGLIRISAFQDNTVQEVKEALASLQTDGMRVLILDLRGNPGGAFKAAVQVAGLFLGEGVVVLTQSPHPEYHNKSHRVHLPNPVSVPMVVLIDGDTASAAEVLAGALKEHRRATLVGQTTFGKGSIQCLIPLDRPPLDRTPGGIRITVARIYSPASQPYNEAGVRPDVAFAPEGDPVVAEARRLLLGMLKPMPPMPPVSPMGMGAPR